MNGGGERVCFVEIERFLLGRGEQIRAEGGGKAVGEAVGLVVEIVQGCRLLGSVVGDEPLGMVTQAVEDSIDKLLDLIKDLIGSMEGKHEQQNGLSEQLYAFPKIEKCGS